MIGSSKNKRENYPRKCFWTQEKETTGPWIVSSRLLRFNPWLKFLVIVTTMFTIKNEVCFLKICSQYAKRKIYNTVRVCSSQISSIRHLPHPSLVRPPFRQSTNTPTHPLRWNCSLLRSRRKFKSHRKEAIGNVEICRAKKLLSHVDRFCPLKARNDQK